MTCGISMPRELHAWALARAASQGRSLSNYIAQLIRQDRDAANSA
jgi:predicted HicB family RNase H-like nuclease